ncbi:MAG: polysaccharide pyruvyl transferase family protein, partial [Acidimicrobiia bacterium]
LVVGERLHACVLAAASGRPFVGIEYRPKVADFADSVGMSEFVTRSDQLSGDRLVELAAEAMTTSLDEMNRAVERYRSVLMRAGESIETAVRG